MLKSLLSKRHGDKTNICNRRPGVNCRENACSKRLIKQVIWEWSSILSETRSWRLFQGLFLKKKRSQKCDTHCLGCSRMSPHAALSGSLGQPAVRPTAPRAPRRKAWVCGTGAARWRWTWVKTTDLFYKLIFQEKIICFSGSFSMVIKAKFSYRVDAFGEEFFGLWIPKNIISLENQFLNCLC